ncbi:hypothetical protein SAMN04489867_0633 [Pedococcus dokdonensis]|uniref:Cell division protein FtsL n=1 Tax=Pedococcus dokdonensis TaxID=443156 RepID=A0A1H0MJU1_9MICO|nr:hypothetical protein [Pedococcus dokdonensis]SDO80585.1 hypothetical protein SAMN04489867_0633 [Pedococcus dokdonensis]
MSQQTATARVAPRAPARRVAPPQPLRVVPAAVGQPGNGVFAALCMTLLCAGLVGLLMLNTAMAEGSFTLHNLQSTSGELADTQDALTQAIDAQRSPANLATRATRLGMVPADSAAFLRLSDGKVLGVAKPAKKGRGFTVVTAPAATSARTATTGKPATTKPAGPSTKVTKKGDVTTTTVVVAKADGTVVTTVTSVNAKTGTTTSTTTTKKPVKKPTTTRR